MIASSLAEPAFQTHPSYVKTLGPEVCEIAALAGFAPDPEQEAALDLIFAVGVDNKVAALEAAIVAPRQNIKTGLFKQCALGWLFVTDQRLVVWSAHEFSTSQESHRDLSALITDTRALSQRVKAITNGNGDEGIELKTGQRVKFRARTKTGGRGLSGDKVVLDEAFALRPTHMGSLFPLLSVRPDPQVVYGSSAGSVGSDVLRSIRDRGRAGDPGLIYVEYADDLPGECEAMGCSHAFGVAGCILDDERRWLRANSQAGRRMTMSYLRGERRAMPPLEFFRERLGRWEDPPDTEVGVFLSWPDLADLAAEQAAPQAFAVAVATDRSWSAVAAAWRRADGAVQVTLTDYRPSTEWIADRIVELKDRWGTVAVVASTTARGLVPGATEPAQGEQAQAHTHLDDLVRAGQVRHRAEPALLTAVRGARWKPYGDTRMFDRKGELDISPLDAVALAAHALSDTAAEPRIRTL